MTTFSILVPCYNEQERLPASMVRFEQFLKDHPGSEIIFIDDGSTDQTKVLLDKMKEWSNGSVKVVSLYANCGKWAALRTGALYAEKEYCVISDADYSVNLSLELREVGLDGKTVFIGNRYFGNNDIAFKRWLPSRIFNGLTRLMTGLKFMDSQAPFKVWINNRVMKDILLDMYENRFAGDVEFLLLCQHKNIIVRSTMIDYDLMSGSSVNVRKHGMEMFTALSRIRRRKYD